MKTMQITDEHRVAAQRAFEALPAPDYAVNYQPTYADSSALLAAMAELHATRAVTTPEQIMALGDEFEAVATGKSNRPIITAGECTEEVHLAAPIELLVGYGLSTLVVVHSILPKATVVARNRGQNNKPRSSFMQTLADGRVVVSYMGDAVNGQDASYREPDPTRLVAAGVQARDLEAGMTRAIGEHVPAAHEVLHLAYDGSFVEQGLDGKEYLLSADAPWIGKRTNDADGPHARFLAGLENSIGAKIGPDSTPEHIRALQQRLNPGHRPGRLTFMLRIGLENVEARRTILEGISDHAPEALIQYDMHAATRMLEDGTKVRHVGAIIEEIQATAEDCARVGLKLHGLHLEVMADDFRLECVDGADQRPTHQGIVDPQLNPRQTRQVLREAAAYLL